MGRSALVSTFLAPCLLQFWFLWCLARCAVEETILLAHTGRAAVAAFSPRGQALRFGVDLEACASINLQPGRAFKSNKGAPQFVQELLWQLFLALGWRTVITGAGLQLCVDFASKTGSRTSRGRHPKSSLDWTSRSRWHFYRKAQDPGRGSSPWKSWIR